MTGGAIFGASIFPSSPSATGAASDIAASAVGTATVPGDESFVVVDLLSLADIQDGDRIEVRAGLKRDTTGGTQLWSLGFGIIDDVEPQRFAGAVNTDEGLILMVGGGAQTAMLRWESVVSVSGGESRVSGLGDAPVSTLGNWDQSVDGNTLFVVTDETGTLASAGWAVGPTSGRLAMLLRISGEDCDVDYIAVVRR